MDDSSRGRIVTRNMPRGWFVWGINDHGDMLAEAWQPGYFVGCFYLCYSRTPELRTNWVNDWRTCRGNFSGLSLVLYVWRGNNLGTRRFGGWNVGGMDRSEGLPCESDCHAARMGEQPQQNELSSIPTHLESWKQSRNPAILALHKLKFYMTLTKLL